MTTSPLPREDEVFAAVLSFLRQRQPSEGHGGRSWVVPTSLGHIAPPELKQVLLGRAVDYLSRMVDLGLLVRDTESVFLLCHLPADDRTPNKEHRTMVIHKYPLRLGGETNNISMPKGAQLLHVAAQETPVYEAQVCVWALVDPKERVVTRQFLIVGTGHPVPAGKYVGTALMDGGALVWHVFDRGEVLLTRTGGSS